ncbi:7066_t:CDS:1, partial [Acaulospora colombiana]
SGLLGTKAMVCWPATRASGPSGEDSEPDVMERRRIAGKGKEG